MTNLSPAKSHFALVLFLSICSAFLPVELLPDLKLDRSSALAQTASEESENVLLRVEGTLEEGDSTFEDGSFYDEYVIEGQAGETISISLESLDFDTYLLLNNEAGDQLAENDDIPSEIISITRNSWMTVTLPVDGKYLIHANSYREGGRGDYRLTVILGESEPLLSDVALRQSEALRLQEQGVQQFGASQFRESLESSQAALAIFREIGDRAGEGRALGNLGSAYRKLGQYQQAIDLYEQRLSIAREIDDRAGEGNALGNLGIAYAELGQYQKAIDLYEQQLTITREIGDRTGEGNALGNWGNIHNNLGQYQQAIDLYEQQLTITREIGDRTGERNALGNWGNVHRNLGQYQQAIDLYEQQLTIIREIGDRTGEGDTLGDLGTVYKILGQYQQAIDLHEQHLAIAREIDDRIGEGNALGNLGSVYLDLGQYQQAIDFSEQVLNITRETGDRVGEFSSLGNLAIAYQNLGQYQQAIDLYEQGLNITREIGDRSGEGAVLGNLGVVYDRLGQYQQAIGLYEQHLAIAREMDNRYEEGNALGNLGGVYLSLGQYQQAIDLFNQHIPITREIGARAEEGASLGNLGGAYLSLEQYQQAIGLYEQHLAIAREIGDRAGEGSALGNLGIAYENLGQYQQAIDLYEQKLAIAREIGDRAGEGSALGNWGSAYYRLGQYQQAMKGYQQALAIAQAIGTQEEEGLWLSNIGSLLAEQDQAELAIVFYKQSVNVRESIRDGIQDLSQNSQQSYTETIAESYRSLADLLLQQNRVLEAQRVLDLLKVQELEDYLRGVRSTTDTQRGIDLFDPETGISNRAIAVGRKLAALRAIPLEDLSATQKQELAELDTAQLAIIADFLAFIESPEIQILVDQLSTDAEDQDVLAKLDEFTNLQKNLQQIGEQTVLIYPLILKDRLELVLITPFSEPARYPVAVGRVELNRAIVDFRQALRDPSTSDAQASAQQLYDWLIAPMANDLAAINADTILYAPDGPLRYIPLAALHNGDQWLVEQFRINHITAASLQNLTLQDASQPQILAAAFSEGSHTVEAGDRTFDFEGLPFAGQEVENLASAFPGTTKLINDEFSRAYTEVIMDSHNIVHLATHAAFVQGSPNDSFILFGNGEHVTLEEIKRWRGRFNQVDLFVLSACETGVGGPTFGTAPSATALPNQDPEELGNGEEILGFGYLMQKAGAAAAIASLWRVSDGGTQALMDAFYAALQTGHTKTEALQWAQQALITGDYNGLGLDERGAVAIRQRIQETVPQPVSQKLSHPYYWAPFILIGNGL